MAQCERELRRQEAAHLGSATMKGLPRRQRRSGGSVFGARSRRHLPPASLRALRARRVSCPRECVSFFITGKDPKRHEEYTAGTVAPISAILTKAKGSTARTRYPTCSRRGTGQYLVLYTFDHPEPAELGRRPGQASQPDLRRWTAHRLPGGSRTGTSSASSRRRLSAAQGRQLPGPAPPITPTSHKLAPIAPGIPLNNRHGGAGLLDCSDPKRDEEFNSGTHTHIPDLKSKGLVRSRAGRTSCQEQETALPAHSSPIHQHLRVRGQADCRRFAPGFPRRRPKTFGGAGHHRLPRAARLR